MIWSKTDFPCGSFPETFLSDSYDVVFIAGGPAGYPGFRASPEDIARFVHAHPTLPEAIKEAALAVDGRTLNL